MGAARAAQVGGVAYINDGLALHCVGCPATANTAAAKHAGPSKAGTNTTTGRNNGGGNAGKKGGGGLAALFGRRGSGSGGGPDVAPRVTAASDSDSATATAANGWACTLHLYAPPIRRVKVRGVALKRVCQGGRCNVWKRLRRLWRRQGAAADMHVSVHAEGAAAACSHTWVAMRAC